MVEAAVQDAVSEVLQAQTRRARLYAAFHTAFREMCSTKNEGMYLKLLPQLTEEFRTVSEGVMACEKRLLSQGQFDLAKTIRLIQDQERTKLQATISLQALQKAYAFETLPWQNGDEAAWSEPTASRLTGEHPHGEHSCCNKDHGGSIIADPSQVTQSEWSDACAQATTALEKAVTCINEALEEIRYEVLDDDHIA